MFQISVKKNNVWWWNWNHEVQCCYEFPFLPHLSSSYRMALKVGVNHGIFHVYHFWNFLIFKCTWVCSSSSSKNKSIFLNLSINSINLKTSIYLSISKMCSSFFAGKSSLRAYSQRKAYNAVSGAALSAIYIEGTRLTFELARWPWQPVRFFENNINSWHLLRNNEHIFLDFMDITVWI